MASAPVLRSEQVRQLFELGFLILPQLLTAKQLEQITATYDRVMGCGPGAHFRVGRTTTRRYFVDCVLDFEAVYQHPALLEAVARLIGQPFKLSSLLGRTLRAGSSAQDLHRDIARDSRDAPMVAFILMIDPFRPDNGATRFVPGSQNWPDGLPEMAGLRAECAGEVLGCGTAGSMIVFNGAVWHGHTANLSSTPRRSVQGYFVQRSAASGLAFFERLSPEARTRMCPAAAEPMSRSSD